MSDRPNLQIPATDLPPAPPLPESPGMRKWRDFVNTFEGGPSGPDPAKVVEGFRLVLEGLGIDLDTPHFADTPDRAAKAWWNELCRGLTNDPPSITTFPSDSREMVLLRGIPVKSLCAHHLLPFVGTATVAYVPGGGQILGLSKLSRIVDFHARRPQVQEELTTAIADHIKELVMPHHPTERGGVGVVIRANHFCMELRGVQHSGDMVTSALRGVFRNHPETRDEFLRLAYHNGG